MELVDEIWETAKQDFDDERVDLDIITPESLEKDGGYDDELEEDRE